MLRTNDHQLWMVPASNLIVFGSIGLVVGILTKIWPRTGAKPAILVFGLLLFLATMLTIPGLHPAAIVLLACGLSWQFAKQVGSRFVAFLGSRRWGLPAILLGMFVFGLVEYWRVETRESRVVANLPTPSSGTPNILLLVLDTVRADALSAYGYHRQTSPNLSRLAERGVRFGHARSTAPWTLPSHASMFTGRLPSEMSARVDRPLDSTYPTLAEFLADRGYATAAFVANTYYCNSQFGLDRGFSRYEDHPQNREVSPEECFRASGLGRHLINIGEGLGFEFPGSAQPRKDAAQINEDLLEWLGDETIARRPFFAFLNYFDAHSPYLLPAGVDRRLGETPTPADHKVIWDWEKLLKSELPQRNIDVTRDAYDDCIAYLDSQIGLLIDELDRRGILENTTVIVTSDHGESWGEHQFFGHGRSLYRPEVHVPLLIIEAQNKATAGKLVSEPASLSDLAATVVDLVGESDESPFPGQTLARFWSSEPNDAQGDPPRSESMVRDHKVQVEGPIPALQGPMYSLVAEGRVYIQNSDGREELYDVISDPAEERNLAAQPGTREQLRRFRQRPRVKKPSPVPIPNQL